LERRLDLKLVLINFIGFFGRRWSLLDDLRALRELAGRSGDLHLDTLCFWARRGFCDVVDGLFRFIIVLFVFDGFLRRWSLGRLFGRSCLSRLNDRSVSSSGIE